MKQPSERLSDRIVLLVISSGLITIIMTIVVGLFLTPRALPNWAENVLVSVATACALKLGDCLSTLVALAGGRQVERLGSQLATSAPVEALKDEKPLGTDDDPLKTEVVNSAANPANVQEARP